MHRCSKPNTNLIFAIRLTRT